MSTRSVKAGSAFVEFFLDDAKLQRGLRTTQHKLRRFGTSLRQYGAGFIKGGLFGLSAIAFPFAKLAEFDDAIRAVGAAANATSSELRMLEETAALLGRTTSFTAVEVATLMGELGRAGFSANQIDVMTESVLALARATKTDAVVAAGIMSTTIRQFGLEAMDAARVANVLTLAANSTFNTVEGLGDSLTYAGKVASDMGMSFEDTVAILGTLGNVGVHGSAAGTALRRLTTLSGAEAEKLEKIFGVAFRTAAGDVRPLVDVLGDVATATNGLPTAQRAKAFSDAFGLLGITAASSIAESAASTKILADELKNVGNEAAEVAAKMDAGPGGMIRRLQSAFEGFQISIGKSVEAIVTNYGAGLTDWLGTLTNIISANPEIAQGFLKLAAGAVAAGSALVIVGGTIQAVAFGIGGLTTAISVGTKAWALIRTVAIASSTAMTTTIIPTIIAYSSTVGIATIATLALKAAVLGGLVVAIGVAAVGLYRGDAAIQAFNRSLVEMNRLTDESTRRFDRLQKQTLKTAGRLEGEDKTAFLKQQLERAKKELAGTKASVKGQTKIVDGLSTGFNVATGNKILAGEKEVLKERQARAANLTSFVEQLEDALGDAEYAASQKATADAKAAGAAGFQGLPSKEKTPGPFFIDSNETNQATGNAFTLAGGLGVGLAGIAANVAAFSEPEVTIDSTTKQAATEAGVELGFAAFGGLGGVTGLLAQDPELVESIQEFEGNAETATRVAANSGFNARDTGAQEQVAMALNLGVKQIDPGAAIDNQTKQLIAQGEKTNKLLKTAPVLKGAKT